MNKILQGDCIEKLKELPSESINMVMTSPPYWALRDYGTADWEGGDENCDHLNGTLQSMKTTLHPGTNQNDKRNFTGMPYKDICKKCGAKRVDKQLGLEPTFDEYINKLCNVFDEVKRVLRKDGTCWVNIGDTYNAGGNYRGKELGDGSKEVYRRKDFEGCKNDPKAQGIPTKCLTLIPFRFAIEMVNRGWILRNTIIWHKPNCMPSSVKDRFTVDFEYLFFFSKSKKYYFETQYEDNADKFKGNRGKNIKRTKLQSSMRTEGHSDYYGKGRNKRTVWKICPRPFKDAHFAVYPEELCETPIKAGCPEQGIVLDPFFGAGTTGLVALKQNKRFIGIELNPEYIEIANKRLKPFMEQKTL